MLGFNPLRMVASYSSLGCKFTTRMSRSCDSSTWQAGHANVCCDRLQVRWTPPTQSRQNAWLGQRLASLHTFCLASTPSFPKCAIICRAYLHVVMRAWSLSSLLHLRLLHNRSEVIMSCVWRYTLGDHHKTENNRSNHEQPWEGQSSPGQKDDKSLAWPWTFHEEVAIIWNLAGLVKVPILMDKVRKLPRYGRYHQVPTQVPFHVMNIF
jgi:hypothetical protein